ncbi:MAG: hypothetical protein HOH58_10225 [Opitutaceae bacterium]|jgi:hypothetical protein|nr:hypothetical protein [Opitutaceae bacterium]
MNAQGQGSGPIDLSSRLIDWSVAGVEGGIPDYAHVIDFDAMGGDSTGLTDNGPLLQSLIDGLEENAVISFSAGIYRINQRIIIRSRSTREQPSLILRGAGPERTKILFMDESGDTGALIRVAGYQKGDEIAITGGLTKGSTSIQFASTDTFETGDWLWIRQDNDLTLMASNRGITGYEANIDNATGSQARVVGQIVKITAVSPTGVTVAQPLTFDYTWPNPRARELGMISGIGFEDFTFENGVGSDGTFNIVFIRAANGWVKNVHSLMAVQVHVSASTSAHIEVRDSFFDNAYRHDDGGHGYGVQLIGNPTHCLVENNIFQVLRHSMIWGRGATGNVFAYNFSSNGKQDNTPVARDISGHGYYAFGNLFEGNIVEFIHASDYWGPIGPNNTFLRNRTTRERILIQDNTRNQNIIGNELVHATHHDVEIESTSTGAFVHGNNEGGTLQWRSGESQSVVDSYFYSSRPSYWPSGDAWPAMGPEYTPGANTIPAAKRWDSGNMARFSGPAGTGRLSNLSTRGQVLTGNDIMIAGFVVGGTSSQKLLLRGTGPALDAFLDPATVLDNPELTVYRGSDVVFSNDDWSTPTDSAEVAAVTATVGGFALADGSHDASLVADFAPGPYSVHLSGNGGTGIALAEIYDAEGGANAQLLNISTRGRVGSGATVMVPGIVVTESNRRLLIRGIGPELQTSFGFAPGTTLADPVLILTKQSGDVIAANDNWEDNTHAVEVEINAVARKVGAFALTRGGADAVLLVTLPPGVYTAQVTDRNGGEGIAIVEVYAVTE